MKKSKAHSYLRYCRASCGLHSYLILCVSTWFFFKTLKRVVAFNIIRIKKFISSQGFDCLSYFSATFSNIILILSLLITSILILALIIALLAQLLSWKERLDTEKLSPFECGFNSKDSHRIFFSVHFFLVALIFVIFDVELILLFPIIAENIFLTVRSSSSFFSLVIILLTLGLVLEWGLSILEWKNFFRSFKRIAVND